MPWNLTTGLNNNPEAAPRPPLLRPGDRRLQEGHRHARLPRQVQHAGKFSTALRIRSLSYVFIISRRLVGRYCGYLLPRQFLGIMKENQTQYGARSDAQRCIRRLYCDGTFVLTLTKGRVYTTQGFVAKESSFRNVPTGRYVSQGLVRFIGLPCF